MGIDEVGIDKVGIDEVGINLLHNPVQSTSHTPCFHDYNFQTELKSFQYKPTHYYITIGSLIIMCGKYVMLCWCYEEVSLKLLPLGLFSSQYGRLTIKISNYVTYCWWLVGV